MAIKLFKLAADQGDEESAKYYEQLRLDSASDISKKKK